MIVALPTATPVTTPVDAPTVATALLFDDQANVAPTAVPNALRAAALSCTEAPTATDVVFPLIETLAMVCEPVFVLPGEVGESPPPPPQATIAIASVEEVNARARRADRAGKLRRVGITQ